MNVPETFFSTSEELRLFLLSCAAGAVIGVFFDIFRALRLLFRHNWLLVLIEDLVFLCSYAVFVSAFASAEARGELRVYFFIGNALGFTVYYFTLGNIVLRTLSKVFAAVRKLLVFILKPLGDLYVLIRKKAADKFVGSNQGLVKFIKKMKLCLQKPLPLLYNKKESRKRKNVNGFAEKKNKRKNQKSKKKQEQKSVQQRTF